MLEAWLRESMSSGGFVGPWSLGGVVGALAPLGLWSLVSPSVVPPWVPFLRSFPRQARYAACTFSSPVSNDAQIKPFGSKAQVEASSFGTRRGLAPLGSHSAQNCRRTPEGYQALGPLLSEPHLQGFLTSEFAKLESAGRPSCNKCFTKRGRVLG